MDLSVLGVANTDNDDGANSNNIIFTLKETELYVSVVTLSKKKSNWKLSKFLSKGIERSVSWNEYKTKSQNKNTAYVYRYFPESNFVEVNWLFLLI